MQRLMIHENTPGFKHEPAGESRVYGWPKTNVVFLGVRRDITNIGE
jgi:hypothetical protein